jgi:hypothetical protein
MGRQLMQMGPNLQSLQLLLLQIQALAVVLAQGIPHHNMQAVTAAQVS